MIYLTNAVSIPEEFRDGYGFLASSIYSRNEKEELPRGVPWILDNDAYSGKFDAKRWARFMLNNIKYQSTCIGVTIPDKVGDSRETLRLFSRYYQIVKDFGYKVSFVAQDGIMPEETPRGDFDTLFIGGSTEYKLSDNAIYLSKVAKNYGKHVHVGRVNSEKRMKFFWFADSVDGTQFARVGKGKGVTRRERQIHDMARFYKAIIYCRDLKAGKIENWKQFNLFQGEKNDLRFDVSISNYLSQSV